MSVTFLSQVRFGNTTEITVSSNLVGSPIYFHWYLDGAYLGVTTDTTYTITLSPGDQGRLDVEDTLDPSFDPIANAPTQYPARFTVVFIRSIASDIDKYIVEQQKNGGSWSEIGRVQDDAATWEYQMLSPRLDDLSTYAWRVTPVDTAGNNGTVSSLSPEYIVRTPDAPKFGVTFNAGPKTVTFAAA